LYFRLDTLDRQLHTAERRVNAHVQLQKVEDTRLQRHMRRQVLHLERDLVDAELRDIKQYVRLIIATSTPKTGRRIAVIILRRAFCYLVVGLAHAGALLVDEPIRCGGAINLRLAARPTPGRGSGQWHRNSWCPTDKATLTKPNNIN
jgi:hypothetical protein